MEAPEVCEKVRSFSVFFRSLVKEIGWKTYRKKKGSVFPAGEKKIAREVTSRSVLEIQVFTHTFAGERWLKAQ